MAFLVGLGIVVGTVSVITTAIYFITSWDDWKINEYLIEAFNDALKMQQELEKRERDPCTTPEQRKEIEKLKQENLERMVKLLKRLHDRGIDRGKDFAKYQYFPHVRI